MLACVLLPHADPALARRLFAVSPLLEQEGNTVFLDVRGTARLHGGTAGLFAAIRKALAPELAVGLALAPNRFTAEVAARYSPHVAAIAPGEEALFLAGLPLSALPLSPALARRLAPLGLETLGDFASLPSSSVERRYGPEGLALQRLARGLDERGILPERAALPLRVLHDWEQPVERLDRLRPVLEKALQSLSDALQERGRGIVRLALQLEGDGAARAGGQPVHSWEIIPAAPETRVPLLLDLALSRLTRDPPPGPVRGLALEVLESQPLDVHQNQLFDDVSRDASRKAEALSRLGELLGEAALATPRLRAAHRREQRWTSAQDGGADEGPAGLRGRTAGSREGPPTRPPRGPALRLCDPPEALVPISLGGRLVGFRRGRREIPVARLSPPRRLEGGWWSQAWARDEHELQTPDGSRLLVCRDMTSKRWLLLGEFD